MKLEKAKRIFASFIDEPIIKILPLDGGLSNSLFLINGNYVLRLKEASDVPFYNVNNEYVIQKKAHEIGIAPPLLYFDKEGNFIEPYLQKTENFFKNRESALKEAGSLIKKLHSIKSDTLLALKSFSPFKRFSFYTMKSGKEVEELLPSSFLKSFQELLKRQEMVVSHLDLVPGNFLKSKKKNYIIDYEFASLAHPLFDYASFLSENPSQENEEEKDAQIFLTDTNYSLSELSPFLFFLDALWESWSLKRYCETKNSTFIKIHQEKKERRKKRLALYQKGNYDRMFL